MGTPCRSRVRIPIAFPIRSVSRIRQDRAVIYWVGNPSVLRDRPTRNMLMSKLAPIAIEDEPGSDRHSTAWAGDLWMHWQWLPVWNQTCVYRQVEAVGMRFVGKYGTAYSNTVKAMRLRTTHRESLRFHSVYKSKALSSSASLMSCRKNVFACWLAAGNSHVSASSLRVLTTSCRCTRTACHYLPTKLTDGMRGGHPSRNLMNIAWKSRHGERLEFGYSGVHTIRRIPILPFLVMVT